MSTHRLRRTEHTAQRLATTVSTPTSGSNITLPRPYGSHTLQSTTHSGPFVSSKGQEYLLKGLEVTLSDSKKKYSDKVSALLSAWEYVTNYIPAAPPEAIQSVIEWAHRHTLTLVLRGEWPKLAPVAKTHLCVTLQRCASQLVQHPAAAPRCTALLALVNNPWTHPILDSILNGQPDSEHEEEFCCSEKGELLTMRLKILCEDRCEDIAVNLAAACVRSLRRSDRLRSLSESHHVHYMIDVYIVLLYKLKRTQDIFAQLKLMDLNDGLELVQRLSGEKPTKYGTARVWRNSIKAAELVAQYLVTAGMVRPISETGANILEQILNSWALLHAKLKDVAPTLPGMIRKLIEPAESAQHIYIFCAVLAKHFGESIKPLVIELYIRALTTDMNELESQKAKSDKDKERETAKRLSTQFLKLADVVDSNIGIAKECVLTAFSLHPTRACYDRIKELAVACGKAKEDGVSQEGETLKREEPNLTQENNPRENDLPMSTIKIEVKSEITENNSVMETFSAQSSSSIISETQPPYQNSTITKSINFQNEQVTKTFEQTDQLLKSLLTAKKPDKTMSDTTMPAAPTNDRCPLHPKHEPSSDQPLGELCFNCGEFTGSNKVSDDKSQVSEASTMPSNNNMERTLDTLLLIKSETVTGSANYDEKSVPSQVLDGEKLGLSPQLCDDLAVVLNSPRFNLLSWVLDWKELKNSCEQYLENAEEMRNTNKELKFLNIDYSQFKDWPSEDDTKDIFFGIEKGYEQWADLPSDSSEQFGSFQPAAGYKRSSTRRSLDDTTTDSDSGSVLRVRRTARTRKIHRLESSESDYDSGEPKPKRFRGRISSVSDSDSNTQDSQTDSLGSDGCRLETKKKSNKSSGKESSKKRSKTSKLTVESVSHFHMLVNEDARRTNAHEDASGSDVSSNDIITLFSADMDENKRETIKGSAYTAAAQLIITTERRSDPAVLKSLRMYRPQNSKKKPSRISQILQKNLLNKNKDTNNGNRVDCTEQQATNNIAKFAPMLSTLNLNPKIVLTRTDEVDRKLTSRSKKQQQRLSSGDITSELINIKTTMPFSPNNKSVMTYQKKQKEHATSGKNNNASSKNDLDCSVVVDGHRDHHRLGSVKPNLGKIKYDILAKAVRDSDILAKNVPGMNSLDMMVPPRQRSTVNVVQLSRSGIPQSPSSATGTAAATINVSGNTPPRPTRTPSVASNQSSSGGNNSIQLPGTPSSTGGHDSGVGMSPAGQTPPLRSSSNLGTPPDAVGEEANQLPDAASPTTISPTIAATTMTANNPSTIHQLDAVAAAAVIESGTVRTMAHIRRASNQHNNQSPRKSPSSPCSTGAIAIITTTITTTTTTTSPGGLTATPITSEPLKVICKPDGSYQITSLNPNQRNLLGLQNLDDGIGFARQTTQQQQQQQRGTDATGGASSNRNAYDRLTASSVKSTSQSGQNAVLPKFNQAFRKTIYTLSTDTPASGVAGATTDTPLGNVQQAAAAASTQKTTTNLSKAVQTSVPNNQQQPQHQQQQQTNAGSINVPSIIPNLQLPANRQIVSIVPSSGNNGPVNTAISSNQAANQTLTQLVQNASSPSTGVIYTHKVITGNNPNQLNIIPTISHTNSPGGRTPVVKLNIIRPVRQQMTGATIQAVLTPRLQQQQQQQQQTVRTDSLIGSPIEVNNQVSSTTLEQLREFESVLEQVKERSIQPQAQGHHSISNSATTTTVQTQTTTQQTQANKQQQQQISVSALAQQLMMPTQPSANSESFASNNGNTVTFQQESVFSQKVSVAYVNPSSGNQTVTAKVAANSTPTPVVVVTSYCQPAASPALSVTSQSSSSPCVTPAPAPSAGKTPPTPPSAAAVAAKTGVKKSTPKAVKTSATNTSKASPIPKPQQKPQEDEQTAQRIYAILDEYAEQLRNSPDLNNKPAPRRRSNPPTNPSQSSKRKKSSSSKTKPVGQQTSELSPSTDDLGRTMGSEDSSSGVVHVQDSPAGFSAPEEPSVSVNANSHVAAEASAEVRSLTSDSNDGVELNVKRRNLIFTEPGSGQPRTVIVQEALQPNSVSVTEALASVTGKMGGASVLMPTSIVLPLVKGTPQHFTIVSSGSKLLATMPTTMRAGGNANTLVLQSFLNQGTKLITTPHVKQMKVQPTLQTLSNNNQTLTGAQNVQSASVVIPQTGSAQFAGETAMATVTTSDVKSNVISDLTMKNEAAVAVGSGIAVESAATNAAIVVNKSNNPTISLIGTRNINEISDSQQICGVITSNPMLQGTTRIFNSGIHKLSTPATLKADNVVCIAPAAAAVSHPPDRKSPQDGREIHAEKPVSIQPGATIALTFASQTDVNAMLNDASQQQQKDTKETSTEITSGAKIISPKKRKYNDVIGIQENISPRTLIPNIATSLQNNTKIESSITSTNKQSSVIDSTTQFLVTGGPSSSDSQESSMQQSAETIDGSCKVGNGLLYENARLQEAWESEGKISPDTPWRYVPTGSMNPLSNDSLKGYSRDSDNSESVLQIISKGQGIEMASGQIYPSNTKKYFMNHTLDTPYSNKSNLMKSQLIPRLDRELMQQRIERKAAAYERELKLQKSLSEECEDLGVDEPSTSDLFPEADLLFDTNHSPSFDHSSQDASCSQPLGMKPYNSSYFRSLDSSSGSRDASPTSDFKSNECKRSTSQRARTLKDSLKRGKREKEDLQLETQAKHMRLTLDNLSQDEASNSNSDISRLSPANLGSLENDSSKDMSGHHRVKLTSRSGSKEGTPSSVSSIPSNMKLDIDLDSESLPPSINVNNTSAASSGDESLTLLSGNTADHHTIPSPLSPLAAAGPLLSTHKYTYANKKRVPSSKMRMDSYMAWESPMSERTRSSSEDEDSSISESISSQPEDNVALSNGLEDSVQTLKSLSTDRRCTYVKKKDKLQVNARVVLSRADHKATAAVTALPKRIPKTESIAVTESMVMSSDKASEASEDEAGNIVLMEPADCRARRSSLRGHVKKGCACCNGSPERPKKKTTTTVKSTDHKLKKRLSKQPGKRR